MDFGIYIQQAFWLKDGDLTNFVYPLSVSTSWSSRAANREKLLEKNLIKHFKKIVPSYDTHMLLGAATLYKDKDKD